MVLPFPEAALLRRCVAGIPYVSRKPILTFSTYYPWKQVQRKTLLVEGVESTLVPVFLCYGELHFVLFKVLF